MDTSAGLEFLARWGATALSAVLILAGTVILWMTWR